MATKSEVEKFLGELRQKLKVWGILYRDERSKNTQTLADLELKQTDRDKIIENLKTQNYCQGPLVENLYGNREMWVFGFDIRNKEVYIKITLGIPSSKVICISFHLSEHKLKYPFKT